MMLLPAAPPWGLIGVAALTASGFLIAGVQTMRLTSEKRSHTATKLEYEVRDSTALRQAIADRDEAQARADAQARAFESWKTAQKSKVQSIRKQVQHDQASDSVCSTRALPDSLRDSLTRAPAEVGATDASEPGDVPRVERETP